MQIKRLYVKNFRNIREQEFCFHENVNVLCGNNAQGKTNLCEAISLCMGPSFRTSRQSSYIPFSLDNSKEKCVIKMWFTTSFNTDSENLIEFTICNNKKEIQRACYKICFRIIRRVKICGFYTGTLKSHQGCT